MQCFWLVLLFSFVVFVPFVYLFVYLFCFALLCSFSFYKLAMKKEAHSLVPRCFVLFVKTRKKESHALRNHKISYIYIHEIEFTEDYFEAFSGIMEWIFVCIHSLYPSSCYLWRLVFVNITWRKRWMTNNVLLKRQLRSDNFRILNDDGVPEIVACLARVIRAWKYVILMLTKS